MFYLSHRSILWKMICNKLCCNGIFGIELIKAAWCISVNYPIIGADNDLFLVRHEAIIWASTDILLIGPLGITFTETLIKIQFSYKSAIVNIICKMVNILSQTQCVNPSSHAQMFEIFEEILWCFFTKGNVSILKFVFCVVLCIYIFLPVLFWHVTLQFLPEASFGLRVLSLPASVCVSVRPSVCAVSTCLSTR